MIVPIPIVITCLGTSDKELKKQELKDWATTQGVFAQEFDIDESSLLVGTLIHINVAIEYLKK